MLVFLSHHHYDHHHLALLAQIYLTLSRHPSLLSIGPGRPSRLHLVSAQSCCISVLAGRLTFSRPCTEPQAIRKQIYLTPRWELNSYSTPSQGWPGSNGYEKETSKSAESRNWILTTECIIYRVLFFFRVGIFIYSWFQVFRSNTKNLLAVTRFLVTNNP